MKLILAQVLLCAVSLQATTITDSFGFSVNVIHYEPVLELVPHDETPAWAALPGMQSYYELVLARTQSDDGFFYRFVLRSVLTQIQLDPPVVTAWTLFQPIGDAPGSNDTVPEPSTCVLLGLGIAMLAYGDRQRAWRAGPRFAERWRCGREAAPVLAISLALAAFCALWGAAGGGV